MQLQGLIVLVQILQQRIRDLHMRRQCHQLLGKAIAAVVSVGTIVLLHAVTWSITRSAQASASAVGTVRNR